MAVMTTADYFRLVEPANLSVFDGNYKQKPPQYKEIFKVEEGEKASYQEDIILSTLGLVPQKPEGDVFKYDKMGQARVQRYEAIEYGLAVAITRKARDDNRHISISRTITSELGKSLRQTKEADHASFINQGFSANQPLGDGQPLFSSAHVRKQPGLTSSNILATPADLSETALEMLLTQMMDATDERGKPIMLEARKLVVPNKLAITARKILGTPLKTGTNLNDINVVSQDNMIPEGIAVMTYFTNPKFWMILTDVGNGFKSINRVDAERGSHGDFDTDNMVFKIYSRWGRGCTEWMAAYASQGT